MRAKIVGDTVIAAVILAAVFVIFRISQQDYNATGAKAACARMHVRASDWQDCINREMTERRNF